MKRSNATIAPISFQPLLRTRLFRHFESNDIYAHWIAGPPGSGKTTLVSSWIKNSQTDCIWVQSQNIYNDISAFYNEISQIVKTNHKECNLPLYNNEYYVDKKNFSDIFFDKLFKLLEKKTALVIDNSHLFTINSEILYSLIVAIKKTKNHNIIIISRDNPPQEFMELVIQQKLNIIDWNELKFTKIEAIKLLKQNGILSFNIINECIESTHGWVSGLSLCSQNGCDKFPQKRFMESIDLSNVFNTFTSDVINKFNHSERRVLLIASNISHWSIDTLSLISSETHQKCNEIINYLYEKNYFIYAKPEKIKKYYFHPFFKNFLQELFFKTFNKKEQNILLERTAEVLLSKNDYINAAKIYSQIRDFSKLKKTIIHHKNKLLYSEKSLQVIEWISTFPQHFLDENHDIYLIKAETLLPSNIKESIQIYQDIYNKEKKQFNLLPQLIAWSGIVNCYCLLFDYRHMKYWINEIKPLFDFIEMLPDVTQQAKILTSLLNINIIYHGHTNIFPKLIMLCESILDKLDNKNQVNITLLLITHSILTNNFSHAHNLLRLTENINKKTYINISNMIIWHLLNSEINWMQGDFESAISYSKLSEKKCVESGNKTLSNLTLYQLSTISLLQNNTESTDAYLLQLKLSINTINAFDLCLYHQLVGWKFLCNKKTSTALDNLKTAYKQASKCEIKILKIRSIFLICMTYLSINDIDEYSNYFEEFNKNTVFSNEHIYIACLKNLLESYKYFIQHNHEKCFNLLHIFLKDSQSIGFIHYFGRVNWILSSLYTLALTNNSHKDFIEHLIIKQEIQPDSNITNTFLWPWKIKIKLLGNVKIWIENNEVTHGKKENHKPYQLLKLLVIQNKALNYHDVINFLWPDARMENPEENLKITVARLRKIIGKQTIIQKSKTLQLNKKICWVDCLAVENIINKIKHEHYTKPNQLIKIMQYLIELYTSDFYVSEKDHYWIESYRESLKRDYFKTLQCCVEMLIQKNEYEFSEKVCWHAIKTNPLNEAFYIILMKLFKKLNKVNEVKTIYTICYRTFDEMLSIQPSKSLRSLHDNLISN